MMTIWCESTIFNVFLNVIEDSNDGEFSIFRRLDRSAKQILRLHVKELKNKIECVGWFKLGEFL